MTPTPTPSASPDLREDAAFPIDDTVGAWVPHGRFVRAAAAAGPLAGLRFAAKDLFDVVGHPTGAGNPTWLATHSPATADAPLVALAFECQLFPEIPVQAHDIFMDKIITERTVYPGRGRGPQQGRGQ